MLLNKKKCPLCNKSKIKFSYTSIKDKIDYSNCENCGLYFQTKINSLTDKNIEDLYTKEYFKKGYTKKGTGNYTKRLAQYLKDKKYIDDFYNNNRKNNILDYGCGNGKFLKLFSGNKFGFEFNKDAIVTSEVTLLSLNQIKKKKFDLIIMRGVIEHIKDFKKILLILKNSLKRSGLFVILATPNTLSYTFIKNKKTFNQNNERHLYHFNYINLTDLFIKLGLYNIDTSFPYFKTPYQNLKRDIKSLKKIQSVKNSPPYVGNMLSMVFKKI